MTLLDRIACGYLVLDAQGTVIYRNRVAEQQLTSLRVPSLLGIHPARHIALNKLLRRTRSPSARAGAWPAISIPRVNKPALRIRILPLSERVAGNLTDARYILLVCDPAHVPQALPEILETIFRLTRAEMEIAIGLYRGDTLAEIARLRGVGVQTVRIQLKTVLAKTQTHRQAELVTLLASLTVGGIQGAEL